MIRLLSICGSPTPGSSTEVLLREIAESIEASVAPTRVQHRLVSLNDLSFAPCQACGEAPTPRWCFLDDELTAVYRELARADCVLFGSPVFFDAVSAQAKAFIDRCNCFRPPDWEHCESEHAFVKLLKVKRPGAIVLVGSESAWFEGPRRCMAGFFKWLEIVNEGLLTYVAKDVRRSGEAGDDPGMLAQARGIGSHLGELLREQYART